MYPKPIGGCFCYIHSWVPKKMKVFSSITIQKQCHIAFCTFFSVGEKFCLFIQKTAISLINRFAEGEIWLLCFYFSFFFQIWLLCFFYSFVVFIFLLPTEGSETLKPCSSNTVISSQRSLFKNLFHTLVPDYLLLLFMYISNSCYSSP